MLAKQTVEGYIDMDEIKKHLVIATYKNII